MVLGGAWYGHYFLHKSELQGVLGCDWCKLFIFDLNILNMK